MAKTTKTERTEFLLTTEQRKTLDKLSELMHESNGVVIRNALMQHPRWHEAEGLAHGTTTISIATNNGGVNTAPVKHQFNGNTTFHNSTFADEHKPKSKRK